MKWFRNLFRQNQAFKNTNDTYRRQMGMEAYGKANDLFHNKNVRDESVLSYYDKAINYGIDEAYGDRAFCLQVLQYHHDALSDFTKALALNSYDPNLYFGRATSKKSLGDLEGSIEDLKMAISLAKIPSKQNDELNKRATELGWNSATALYEMELHSDEEEIKFNTENPDIYERLKSIKTIKRRESET